MLVRCCTINKHLEGTLTVADVRRILLQSKPSIFFWQAPDTYRPYCAGTEVGDNFTVLGVTHSCITCEASLKVTSLTGMDLFDLAC